jgi:hypothetical protein
MMSHHYRSTLLALLVGALSMAGCSSKPATRPAAPATTTASATSAASNHAAASKAKPAAKPLPDSTGIPACDDYLASYVACHRAAAIYPPDQIEPRYQTMRTSLLTDSLDPAIRPQLGARCTSLALVLRQSLHGKSCATISPSTAASSGR